MPYTQAISETKKKKQMCPFDGRARKDTSNDS